MTERYDPAVNALAAGRRLGHDVLMPEPRDPRTLAKDPAGVREAWTTRKNLRRAPAELAGT